MRSWSRDIAKAYESDDGQTVVITDEDIATLPERAAARSRCWSSRPASEIDPLMYDRSYFLEPDSKSSKSYVLLAKTLAETDRVAIVHFCAAEQDAPGRAARRTSPSATSWWCTRCWASTIVGTPTSWARPGGGRSAG